MRIQGHLNNERNRFGSVVSACRLSGRTGGTGTIANCARKTMVLSLVSILLVLALPSMCGAQQQKKKDQAEFLVARNQIQDPFFRHSVVFMLPKQNGPLIVGLIINRPTRVTLDRLFPSTPEFENRTEPAYFGGPVDVRFPSVVFRSLTVPKRAVRLYDDVYLTFDHDLIIRLYQNSQKPATPRMFLGRAQWAPAQLQNEIRRGGWYKVHADADLLFTAHPHDIWQTLHNRAAPSKYIRYQLPSGNQLRAMGKAAVM